RYYVHLSVVFCSLMLQPPLASPLFPYTTLFRSCNLLRAFAHVAEKPADWSEGVIATWNRQLSDVELANDRLDYLIRRFIEEKLADRDAAGCDDDPLLTAPSLREQRVKYKRNRWHALYH